MDTFTKLTGVLILSLGFCQGGNATESNIPGLETEWHTAEGQVYQAIQAKYDALDVALGIGKNMDFLKDNAELLAKYSETAWLIYYGVKPNGKMYRTIWYELSEKSTYLDEIQTLWEKMDQVYKSTLQFGIDPALHKAVYDADGKSISTLDALCNARYATKKIYSN